MRSYIQRLQLLADHSPTAVAILSPDGTLLTYAELWKQIQNIARTINAMGLGRRDQVAMMLPSGPDAAVCFLAVGACATTLMLDEQLRGEECNSCFSDLCLKALIVPEGSRSPAVPMAQQRGIMLIELLTQHTASSGLFDLRACFAYSQSPLEFAEADDTAVIIRTSGTAARPKFVPLTHANIFASAINNGRTYDLTASDRCLDFMPMFNAHGLIMTMLTSLVAGGSVICTPGFDSSRFFDWVNQLRPTWYSAVPTIHQAIVARAAIHGSRYLGNSLRFIRSASSPLSRRLMEEVEAVFGIPVVEGYGMTEASSQITSNPLPPACSKVGSVGIAAGPEIAVMDETGRSVKPDVIGEIMVRGPSIMKAYLNDPDGNRVGFIRDWFRTGDLGFRDIEGYLFIVGRLKDMINRGGVKIAPSEVDEILMNHPAIAYAVAFPVPHRTLGEDLAAAVVLREGQQTTEKQIREYVFGRLPYWKVPQFVFILDCIPMGPTGKPLRVALTQRFGHTVDSRSSFAPAITPVEKSIEQIWIEVLRTERVSIRDDFFALGGDSLSAVQVASRVRDVFDVELSLSDFFNKSTIEEMASLIQARIS